MKRKGLWALIIIGAISLITIILKKKAKQSTYIASSMAPISKRSMGFYEKYIKRIIDILLSSIAIVFLSPVFIIVGLLVKLKLGSPILFTQDRPGLVDKNGRETIFKMYKFRTMTNENDAAGGLLPDEKRLTKFGAWLRSTSLDELPELFNILNGTMSIIGPRPQLVRDMVFMSDEQRRRHTARPGLSGLAQINGRNAISWEEKLNWDQKYIERISFKEDLRIIFQTLSKAFIKREGITDGESATSLDYGDALLTANRITVETYKKRKEQAELVRYDCR